MKNEKLQKLIEDLNALSIKEGIKLWKRVANELSRPSRNRREVNLSKVSKSIKEGEIALVPGKLLGQGDLDKKVQIAAYSFSKTAESKADIMTIEELFLKNPKGQKVRIIG
tara:strand:- start:36 stop:368 length:333 start_codon:yes stop_codon:yes gene_type:complete